MTFALTVAACALVLSLPSVSAESAELEALMTEMETMTLELVELSSNTFLERP